MLTCPFFRTGVQLPVSQVILDSAQPFGSASSVIVYVPLIKGVKTCCCPSSSVKVAGSWV